MPLTELQKISIKQYLEICNFKDDYIPPDINITYLIEPYSNGLKSTGFKLIHKIIFFPELLKKYIIFLQESIIMVSEFLLQQCKKISLIQLCINFRLIESFDIICNISPDLFLNGIYNSVNIFIDCDKLYICEYLDIKNSKYIDTYNNILAIYLDNYKLYTYIKNNKSVNLCKLIVYNLKKIIYVKNEFRADKNIDIKDNNTELYIDFYEFLIKFLNIKFKDIEKYNIDINFYIEYIDSYRLYIINKNYQNALSTYNNFEIYNRIIYNTVKNYKIIDYNKIKDINILRIVIQCFKLNLSDLSDLILSNSCNMKPIMNTNTNKFDIDINSDFLKIKIDLLLYNNKIKDYKFYTNKYIINLIPEIYSTSQILEYLGLSVDNNLIFFE